MLAVCFRIWQPWRLRVSGHPSRRELERERGRRTKCRLRRPRGRDGTALRLSQAEYGRWPANTGTAHDGEVSMLGNCMYKKTGFEEPV